MITSKKWYQSKIFWGAVVTMAIGAVPLGLEFARTIAPNSITIISAVATLITGALTLVWRVFFTNQVIG